MSFITYNCISRSGNIQQFWSVVLKWFFPHPSSNYINDPKVNIKQKDNLFPERFVCLFTLSVCQNWWISSCSSTLTNAHKLKLMYRKHTSLTTCYMHFTGVLSFLLTITSAPQGLTFNRDYVLHQAIVGDIKTTFSFPCFIYYFVMLLEEFAFEAGVLQ